MSWESIMDLRIGIYHILQFGRIPLPVLSTRSLPSFSFIDIIIVCWGVPSMGKTAAPLPLLLEPVRFPLPWNHARPCSALWTNPRSQNAPTLCSCSRNLRPPGHQFCLLGSAADFLIHLNIFISNNFMDKCCFFTAQQLYPYNNTTVLWIFSFRWIGTFLSQITPLSFLRFLNALFQGWAINGPWAGSGAQGAGRPPQSSAMGGFACTGARWQGSRELPCAAPQTVQRSSTRLPWTQARPFQPASVCCTLSYCSLRY